MRYCGVTTICLAVLVLPVAATLWAQDAKAPQSPSASSTVETSRRQLWRSNIRTPKEDGASSKGLQNAIARLRQSLHGSKPAPVARLTTTRPATTQPKTPAAKPAVRPPSVMTAEIIEKIRKLNSVEDPAALADALFQAKHPDLAVAFYDRAIKGATTPDNKAWLLFQAGNCSRRTKPQAALKAYDALVTAYPGSLWSSIAKVQKGIVEWRNNKDMVVLLNDIEGQGQESSDLPQRK